MNRSSRIALFLLFVCIMSYTVVQIDLYVPIFSFAGYVVGNLFDWTFTAIYQIYFLCLTLAKIAGTLILFFVFYVILVKPLVKLTKRIFRPNRRDPESTYVNDSWEGLDKTQGLKRLRVKLW